MNATGLFSINPPSESDLAAYHERITEVGFVEASFWFVKQHAERLMCPVVDLDSYRLSKEDAWA